MKVCGLTRAIDVEAALFAGADALGFVLHAPSPRSVSPGAAADLCRVVGDRARTYLVLVDGEAAEVEELRRTTGASGVQLCGAQRPRDFASFPGELLVRLNADENALECAEAWRPAVERHPGRGFVLEPPGVVGGSGRPVDLEQARLLAERLPCLLAGGLTADNVAERIARTSARGVDASSGLELSHGIKDPVRLTRFVRSGRRALDALDRTTPPSPKPFPQAS
ncbi:MAG: phosphoribosylanthranilate isomerase [Planctomycetota bacterium]